MTRQQLWGVGVLSVLATILVLFSALNTPGSAEAARAEIERQLAVVGATAVIPATTAATTADASTTTTTASADDATGETAAAAELGDATADVGATDDSTGDYSDADTDTGTPDAPASTTPALVATNVKHVFVITLKGQGFDNAFGAGSAAPYLAGELRQQGTLLTKYSSLGAADLPDRLAFLSGQPPNAATRANCTTYSEVGALEAPSSSGEITKDGCVYPNTIISLADQFPIAHLNWKGYSEDQEKGPKGAVNCRRPDSDGPDGTQAPRPGDGYAARNNPFIYFHSLLDLSGCDSDAGPLSPLATDLQTVKTTRNFSYIAPSLYNDGSSATGVDGGPGGLAAADAFLKAWVPKILASPAYQADGVLIITFAGGTGAGDGPTNNGTLVVSRFAKAGGTDDTEYNPYGLLASVEDLFGVKRLAKAQKAPSFASTVLASAKVIGAGDD